MLKKVSVSTVPRFDITVGNAREDAHVFCHGKTAKLHSRNGGLQDEKQVSACVLQNKFILITGKFTRYR